MMRNLLFVHIREPEEIERFRQAAGVNCKTILVRRPTLEQARGQLGNRSDDGVAAYAYDAEFLNDGSLEELPAKVHDFLQAPDQEITFKIRHGLCFTGTEHRKELKNMKPEQEEVLRQTQE